MEKKNRWMRAAGTAAAIGAVAGAVKIVRDAGREAKEQADEAAKKRFEELVKNQYVTGLFTAAEAKTWFEETAKGEKAGVMYIGFFTPQMAERFGISDGEPLDPEHYLLQVAENSAAKKIIDMRLINFGELPPKFEKLLRDQGGMACFGR